MGVLAHNSAVGSVLEIGHCVYGRRRQIHLANGAHREVILMVEQVDERDAIEFYRHVRNLPGGHEPGSPGKGPGFWVKYKGHKEDLVSLGCISSLVLRSSDTTAFTRIRAAGC